MLLDSQFDTSYDATWTVEDGGKAIAIVIDEDVVFCIAAQLAFHQLLLNFVSGQDAGGRDVADLSGAVIENSRESDGSILLDFVKNGEVIETIKTQQEMLATILLSSPKAIVLRPEVVVLGVEPGWFYRDGDFVKPEIDFDLPE